MAKIGKTVTMISVQEWDDLVEKTYGKVYSFQQQDDCKPRGTFNFSVPSKWGVQDYEATSNPMVINGPEMGVSFKTWLETDPNTPVFGDRWSEKEGKSVFQETTEKSSQRLVWERNFYPDVGMIIDDLYKKGLIDEGEYVIEIDW